MDINPKQRVVIIGCGYSGQRVAQRCLEAGAEVCAVVRSAERVKELQQLGIPVQQIDFDQSLSNLQLMLNNALVFYCMPPPSSGAHDDPRMAAFIQLLAKSQEGQRLQAIVYLSTTGVYGDCRGAWVTESSLPAPLSPRASRRLAAENRLKKLNDELAIPVSILRVAAIYGPGRLPVATIREGRPVLNENEAPYSNRIHVDDLAQVCIAAGQRAKGWQVYNVSDGHPETMTRYYNRVADLSGLERPETLSWSQAQSSLPPGMLDFLKESKKVDNLNMLHELDIDLQYPDLDSGLRASLEGSI
jgi:nucleoside-diphosphate-sugar epimerase